MFISIVQRPVALTTGILVLSLLGLAAHADTPSFESPPIVHKVEAASERLEMVVNSSRMLTLDQKIPRAQVNNRDIVDLTALSPNVIQVHAKKPGVTQVNLWDENNQIHSIDVVVFGDARELNLILQSQFPHASIKVRPTANSVILSGFVPEPDQASQIIKIAEDYYPKVISMLKVGGVQQIMLRVKVMEVSRTKLRTLGVDLATTNNGNFVVSSVSGLIDATAASTGTATGLGGDTVRFGIVNGNHTFFGFLDALRQYNLAKVLAEPTLVTVSGRPAFFNEGGEFPILIPAGLGTVSVDFKKFGTQVDFVPIVLGNGNIRLEVKPRISELDPTTSVTSEGVTVPGLKVREVDTAVEMKAGQTLAIAGLIQTRVETSNAGIPYLADLPYAGALFRKTSESVNEIELLVMVTPELVEPMDPADVPPCGPGMHTDSPNDCELYWKGYMEVPSCGPCGPGGCQMPGNPPESVPPGTQPASVGQQPAPTTQSSNNTRPTPALADQAALTPTPPYTGPRSSPETGSLPLDPSQPIVLMSASRNNPPRPQDRPSGPPTVRQPAAPALIGPVGYDVGN